MARSTAHSYMPGTFISDSNVFDYTLPPKLDTTSVGAKTLIFQPPRTPSASDSLHRSNKTPIIESRESSVKASRKRSRQDYSADDYPMPGASGRDGARYASRSAMSPEPLVNTRYILAGGLDTPGNAVYAREDVADSFYDVGYRRGWCQEGQSRTATPLAENGIRSASHGHRPRTSKDWSSVVIDAVGGVAGKVWEFGRSIAFRGFYAGSGPGFNMQPPSSTHLNDEGMWEDVDQKPDRMAASSIVYDPTPVPGGFPLDDYIPDYISQSQTPPRAAKKVQREKGAGELKSSWVLIDQDVTPPSRPEHSPTRRLVRTPASSRASASRVGRRSGMPPCRASHVSHAGSPSLQSSRPASFASPRPASAAAAAATMSPTSGSPVPIEAQRYAARRRREEKEADASIQRFNHQLKNMIREAKEALGSTVQVEEDEEEDEQKKSSFEDEGFGEGMDLDMGSSYEKF
ncbi:MAG: hypothetical protein M1829_000963 [Trizodia sp. TS-e1964]|nr:MAG: hypothetical protein M1829_000963 [Trizodia sp. TS-e1964]